MSYSGQTTGDLVGLALAGTIIALSWPVARKYFSRWTRLHKLKFVGSILLYVAFGLLWIPFVELLTPRDPAGHAPASTAVGAMLVMFGWIFLGILFLLRYLMDEPKPKWIKQYGIAHSVCFLMVAVGFGIILAVRYG